MAEPWLEQEQTEEQPWECFLREQEQEAQLLGPSWEEEKLLGRVLASWFRV